MILTHVGGPTVLIELDGWRLLTDPTFDPAGGHYDFGWGTSSDKLTGPAIAAAELPHIDAVLLTHDQHGDNLDSSGREVLAAADVVLTTVAAARRSRLPGARGLAPGGRTVLRAEGRPPLEITATPARHGPPLTRPIVGQVTGFAVRRSGESRVALWITGDPAAYPALHRAAAAMDIDVALVHVGGVRFGVTGPVRFTMTARKAIELVARARPRVAVPVHFEGWSHFRSGLAEIEQEMTEAPDDVRQRIRILPLGSATDLSD